MKKSIFLRVVAMMLALTLMLGAMSVTASASGLSNNGSYKGETGTAPTLEEMKNLLTTKTYEDYIIEKSNGDIEISLETETIKLNTSPDSSALYTDAVNVSDSKEVLTSYDQSQGNWKGFSDADKTSSWFLPSVNADGKAGESKWTFNVKDAGFYTIEIDYYDCIIDADSYTVNGEVYPIRTKSSVSAIERKLKIDGVVPFDEVGSITFDKHWEYDYVSESAPVEVAAGARPFTALGSFAEYVHISDGDNAGYYKYVTKTYMEGDKMMQTVTTYKINQDINGNSMAPSVSAVSQWSTYTCKDSSGYNEGSLKFYFGTGDHSISLEAIREPMIIKEIRLVPVMPTGDSTESSGTLSYNKYIAQYAGASRTDGAPVIIEAEFPDIISDSSVAATNDNTSAINYPISSKAQLYNVIGENGYSAMGQWAAYKFTVSETGLYKLGARFKQTALQGMFICRTIKIAGEGYGDGVTPVAPFEEAYRIRFGYDDAWQSEYMGFYEYEYKDGKQVLDDDGNPVQNKKEVELYFEAGVEYTLYFECSLGDLKDYIRKVENALNIINDCYLKILKRTGAEPDKNQDYSFLAYMPEVLVSLLEQSKVLTDVADQLEALCGTNGSHIATLDTVARILTLMGADGGEKIAENMANLKSYLGTLGTWINDSKASKLMLDAIHIVPADSGEDDIPHAKANFFESIWFEISSFIYSFFTDYDKMGLTEEKDDSDAAVSVWLASGRDQSQIWRSMIDATGGFTDTYGKGVALKLVVGGTLLPSILSGKGPDVYIGLGSGDVINYAIRDAIIGVSGNAANLTDEQNAVFTNYYYIDANGNEIASQSALSDEEIKARGLTLVSNGYETATREEIFSSAAMKTLRLCDVAYGIPVTMSFAMMFYRMDVLGNLGLEVPETWDELIGALPALQASNMTIGVSYVSALDFMMYQMGESIWKYENGDLYDSKWAGAEINLDSNIALEAFERVCSFYTEHSLPVTFDTANRFRTGEMPLTIGDYISIYNSLVVFASEIGGLWEFGSLPGSVYIDENGEEQYSYESLAGVSATVLLNGAQKKGNDTLLAAWQFAQWQTSRSVQAEYGNSIVALIGPAAKYETANREAINDLSWTAKEKAAIEDQMSHMDAIVNYPGSYIISRYMKFAFLDAYNDGTPPQEAMKRYVGAINTELTRKKAKSGDFLFNMDNLAEGESVPKKNQ